MTDIEAAALCRRYREEGDEGAFNGLWRQYRNAVYHCLERMRHRVVTRGAQGVDHWELESAALLAFWRAVETYRADAGVRFLSYLCTLVHRNLCKAVAVAATRYRLLEKHFDPLDEHLYEDNTKTAHERRADPRPTAAERVAAAEEERVRRAWVQGAVRQLDEKRRRVVVGTYWFGMTRRQLAGEQGVSHQRVSQLLQSAHRDLRVLLTPPLKPEPKPDVERLKEERRAMLAQAWGRTA